MDIVIDDMSPGYLVLMMVLVGILAFMGLGCIMEMRKCHHSVKIE